MIVEEDTDMGPMERLRRSVAVANPFGLVDDEHADLEMLDGFSQRCRHIVLVPAGPFWRWRGLAVEGAATSSQMEDAESHCDADHEGDPDRNDHVQSPVVSGTVTTLGGSLSLSAYGRSGSQPLTM